ncbi:MAG: hypothetical protein JW787_13135 [Sedimentisphaerales bacterium]|nr:hypothetical protein [Sedimentisphaerales bacterium]
MKIKDYLRLLLIFFMLFLIGIYLKPLLMPRSGRLSPATRAKHDLEVLSKYLVEYYERNITFDKDVKKSNAIYFLENDCGDFSNYIFAQKPKTFDKDDFGVFLILPNKLISDAPTIIAYTTPLEKEKFINRVVLFLNGSNMTPIEIDNYNFEKLIDLDQLEKTPEPDFYYFHSTNKKLLNKTPP